MLLLELLKSAALLDAENALRHADIGSILGCCENYLLLLKDYRAELYRFQGRPEISFTFLTPLNHELIEQNRSSVRAAIERMVSETNRTDLLLKSFTAISGFEAVKTFNRLEYKGYTEWELRANEVRLINDDNNERLTVQEAVEVAGLLRRMAYVSHKITFY